MKFDTAEFHENCCVVLCIVCFVSFCELFVCNCVPYYCHWVTTHLQLTIISILISNLSIHFNLNGYRNILTATLHEGLRAVLGVEAFQSLRMRTLYHALDQHKFGK